MRGWIRKALVAGVVVVVVGALAGLWAVKVIGYDVVDGQATYQIEAVDGPETGPPCPVDKRYLDKAPTGLRDDVLAAYNDLRAKAAAEKVTLCLEDGKRSTRQQQAVFDDYVKRFGSREVAREHALPAGESNHEKGIAVDVQPLSAASWIERSAGKYGWCRRYENEPWHFEYSTEYPKGCPALLPHA